ncbi:BRO-N domain-containing protein [Symbiopectobacterium purcellii]|uniref:BRO-N domain-containing protein n=1 Tax=Symbiopectobacterium purcellii TaxID=2871826 RepID=UPI003F84AF02
MKNHISFNNAQLEIIHREQSTWLRSTQIGLALKYANPKTAVTKIFNRNKDEFTTQMSAVVKLPDANGDMQNTRIFSLRGAHLIAMFANTPIAKEFRKWVLDILDKETSIPQYKPQAAELFNDDDTRCLTHLIWSMANGFHFDREWSNAIWHALRRVTGVPSPQHFEIRQLPLLAEEYRRIYSITNTLKGAIFDAEKQTIRRVLRHREDEAIAKRLNFDYII